MNPGYYIEKELEDQADIYKQTFWPHGSAGASALQKDVEGTLQKDTSEEDYLWMKDFLTKAILMNLREGVRDYARHECSGCRIDHPSQKQHDLCLMTSPQEWIEGYKYHEAALECLNIYNVMEDWDEVIAENMTEHRVRDAKGVHLLTPNETEEAYKCWQYFKKNQKDITDQWKQYWAKKLIETYKQEEQKETKKKLCDWPEPSPPPEFDI